MSKIKRLALLCPLLLLGLSAQHARAQGRAVRAGVVRLAPSALRAGGTIDLTGEWLYRPGYALAAGERPESSADARGYAPVPVPQLLSRTQWWLDDSEDYKRFEEARLKRLGFDTERAEDGWYRLRLDLTTAPPAGRHLFIEFDGVAMKSRVYCNGRLLGEHAGMFSRFGYDLTPHLKAGPNTVAVFVSMEKIPPSALSLGQAVTVNLTASKIMTLNKGMFGPLSPDHNNRSYDLHGIWQPARLVVRDSAKLDDVWFVPSLDGARVCVEARSLEGRRRAVIKARWTDPATGRLFAGAAPVAVDLGAEASPHELTLANVRPRLWTPAEPNLYRLDVTLETPEGRVLDAWSHDVGFRTFEKRGNRFYLNGRPYWLRGANQLPYGKNSWDAELPRRLVRLLHDGNVRVTRTHATPWNEAWLDAADRTGLGVSIEGPRPWALAGKIGLPPADIFRHWLAENEDVVRRGRNHPSVLLWTVGNELLLRDDENLEKWRLLSEVVRQTRRLDPFRPVVADSTYAREEKFYREVLEPNGIDDGDVDDIHRYRGWYSDSPFVVDPQTDMKAASPTRPFVGQEVSTGYPDLDTGLPVLRYTRDLLTPQAWVGQDAYPGKDPAVFLEHNRAVTKRWAEQLRFSRGETTAGFMLFSAECWFAHSYDARAARPYPVYDAVREAWAPVGVALETGRRRFYAGEQVDTGVFVTNDDEGFRDLGALRLRASFVDPATRREVASEVVGGLGGLPYYRTARIPVSLAAPRAAGGRQTLLLVLRLLEAGREVGRSTEPVEIFRQPQRAQRVGAAEVFAQGLGPNLSRLVAESGQFARVSDSLAGGARPAVVLLNGDEGVGAVSEGGAARALVSEGATAVLFTPGEGLVKAFPRELLGARKVTGEYADPAPALGTKLAEGLRPSDVKWWGRVSDWRVFVASRAHRLRPGGGARELLRFIPSHGYIAPERVPEQYMTVLFEIPLGRGRLWVCDLDLEESVGVDPAARLLALNLLRAASDPASTKSLPAVPTHEQQLAGRKSP